MNAKPEKCAREVLETVPAVMRTIRCEVRRSGRGVTLPQFRTLAFLARVGAASLGEASEHLGLTNPAMSRLVGGLVRSGFVTRTTVAENRRKVALALTSKGRAKLESVRAVVRVRLADALGGLSGGELDAVSRALALMQAAFGSGNTLKG